MRERTGHTPSVEVMIPLVAYTGELAIARSLVERVAAEEGAEGVKIGTMIELPRACLKAGAIAAHADFFSFGTNDLTQTGLGFSRDDIEGRIMPLYADLGIVERSPFGTLDAERRGRARRDRAGAGEGREARAPGRRVRRARGRPELDPLLPRRRARLRELLAVPGAGRARGGGAGGGGRDPYFRTLRRGPARMCAEGDGNGKPLCQEGGAIGNDFDPSPECELGEPRMAHAVRRL